MKNFSFGRNAILVSLTALSIATFQETAQAQNLTSYDFDSTGLSDNQVVTNQISGLSISNGSIGYEGGQTTSFYSGSGSDSVYQNKLASGASFSQGFLTTSTLFSSKNLEISFDDIVSSLSFTVADMEGSERLTASIFDEAGILLDSQILSGSTSGAGDGSGLLVSFDTDGISKLVLDSAQGSNTNKGIGYAIDNLQVETSQSVPEPTSVMSLLAVGALGAGALRKRQQQASVKAS